MKLAAHELNILSELTMSCVNSITNMAYMIKHIQDRQLKGDFTERYKVLRRAYKGTEKLYGEIDGHNQPKSSYAF